ncbi:MAG: hypothetical protein PHF86_04925 [Candidatus Nanoarchaeia archaeon]|nr:hypothetical protein [Candidatus Nanoarchaeia archaeon]
MDKTIATVTAYARQYPFEANSTLAEMTSRNRLNYVAIDVLGHPVMITFEEDAYGTWRKKVRIFGFTDQTTIQEILKEVDTSVEFECMVYSRLMDPEE